MQISLINYGCFSPFFCQYSEGAALQIFCGCHMIFTSTIHWILPNLILQWYHLPGKRTNKIRRKVKCVYSSFDCGLFICIIINLLALFGCILTISFHWICDSTCGTCAVFTSVA
eukprot:996327_1